MTQPLIRTALLALATAAPLPALADSVFVAPPPGVATRADQDLTGIRASVARDLRRYGPGGTDVRGLSPSQLATIHHFAHSGQSEGDIRSHIASTLRRGPLQRVLDRLAR